MHLTTGILLWTILGTHGDWRITAQNSFRSSKPSLYERFCSQRPKLIESPASSSCKAPSKGFAVGSDPRSIGIDKDGQLVIFPEPVLHEGAKNEIKAMQL